MNLARLVRAGFFVTGLAFLVIMFFGICGWMGFGLALALTTPFSALIIFGMKCPGCGVSYYFSPSNNGSNLTGVNMLAPVATQCRNCGATR